MSKKRIIVTISHRLDTIHILHKHLLNQSSEFDEWHIWSNSPDPTISEELAKLPATIIVPKKSNPKDGLNNLHLFYKQDGVDIDTNYLKLDDDIVWMEPDFVKKIFEAREQYQNDYFLIYPNIINNAVMSNLHMRFCNIPWNDRCWYNYMDPMGWGNPIFAEDLHNIFIFSIKNNTYQNWYFNKWKLDYKEQLSINAICWSGEDFHKFAPTITGNDEFWINVYGPSLCGKPSIIFGNILCAHYAFHPQKSHLDSTTILEEYRKLVL